jgi:hypothetical protein
MELDTKSPDLDKSGCDRSVDGWFFRPSIWLPLWLSIWLPLVGSNWVGNA